MSLCPIDRRLQAIFVAPDDVVAHDAVVVVDVAIFKRHIRPFCCIDSGFSWIFFCRPKGLWNSVTLAAVVGRRFSGGALAYFERPSFS